MSLLLSKEFPTGFSGEYWKITEININWSINTSRATLSLYKEESIRKTNPLNGIVEQRMFDWRGNDFPFTNDESARKIAYNKIKETEEFKDAKDV